MKRKLFGAVLRRYGQPVERTNAAGETAAGRAFVQPLAERGSGALQVRPTPIGTRRGDRFLYLGEAGLPLTAGDYVECRGGRYRVSCAHPIQVGEDLSHWWGLLRPQAEETP